MLAVGERIPSDARCFTVDATATTVGEHLVRQRPVLLCFYPFDWSPG